MCAKSRSRAVVANPVSQLCIHTTSSFLSCSRLRNQIDLGELRSGLEQRGERGVCGTRAREKMQSTKARTQRRDAGRGRASSERSIGRPRWRNVAIGRTIDTPPSSEPSNLAAFQLQPLHSHPESSSSMFPVDTNAQKIVLAEFKGGAGTADGGEPHGASRLRAGQSNVRRSSAGQFFVEPRDAEMAVRRARRLVGAPSVFAGQARRRRSAGALGAARRRELRRRCSACCGGERGAETAASLEHAAPRHHQFVHRLGWQGRARRRRRRPLRRLAAHGERRGVSSTPSPDATRACARAAHARSARPPPCVAGSAPSASSARTADGATYRNIRLAAHRGAL